MILFCSQVRGEADENSDIDLIVVGDEFKDKSPLKRGGCNLKSKVVTRKPKLLTWINARGLCPRLASPERA